MLRNNRGLSYVELLVVVFMFIVIAALVVPQVIAYGENSANATAAADLRSARVAEEAFFANWEVYASSAIGGGSGMAGRSFNNFGTGSNSTGQIWAASINGTAPSSTIPAPGFQVNVSQNVGLEINTSPMGGSSYTMVSKNASGDRCFGMDSDVREVYWVNGVGSMQSAGGAAPNAIAGANDFGNVAGSAICNGFPSPGQGQVVWVAL